MTSSPDSVSAESSMTVTPLDRLLESLPIPVVDNHVHLDIVRHGDAPVPIEERLAAAASVGVSRAVQIGCTVGAAEWTVAAVAQHPQLLGGVALHPNEVPRLAAAGTLATAYERIEQLAAHERIRVIGETGLDYYRTGPEGRAVQQDGFRWHIEAAKRLGKVLQIHDREAHEDVLRILDEAGAPDRVVMHCFSGDEAFARACLERGFFLSYAGTVTFAKTEGIQAAARITPSDRLLVETDAPYLAPMPHRGKTNSSALIPFTVRALAALRREPVADLCAAIAETSTRLYGPWGDERAADS